MKATGIVRRVDDLGRIVIPKEIRRTLRIREGDPLEIYTEKDGGVIFRKYSPMGDLQEFAAQMCDAIDFMTLDNEARENVGTSPAWLDHHFDWVNNNTRPNNFANTDWISEVLNDFAPQQSYNLTLNGGVGSSGYMLSYRYFDQKGLTVGESTGEQRHNVRFKMDTRLLDRLTLTSNIAYTSRKVTSPVNSLTSGGGAIYTAMRIAPNSPVKYTDGSWAYGGGNTNPVAILEDGGRSVTSTDEFSLLEVLKLDIMKGWSVSATYNLTATNALRDILKKTIFKDFLKTTTTIIK